MKWILGCCFLLLMSSLCNIQMNSLFYWFKKRTIRWNGIIYYTFLSNNFGDNIITWIKIWNTNPICLIKNNVGVLNTWSISIGIRNSAKLFCSKQKYNLSKWKPTINTKAFNFIVHLRKWKKNTACRWCYPSFEWHLKTAINAFAYI